MTLHQEFVRLGRGKFKITNKLVALLPEIFRLRIYEQEGYATIYDYAGRLAGLSSGVVNKALNLEDKIGNFPHLQKVIETQGINKVAIVAGLATKENEKDLADKVENMSKPALQEYSKEVRGHFSVSWQVELDQEMITMFLKLKNKLGKNLSNKECLRKILKSLQEQPKKSRPPKKSPGKKVGRNVSAAEKAKLPQKYTHPGCHRPAEIIHHPERFSANPNHKNLRALCRLHHEFAHNGISEPMQAADYKYRKCRQEALL